jgi:ATP-dependent DNA helicase Rep
VDFDDLISLPLKLLQTNDEARAKWQNQFGHVLVDEYQDTNAVQYELLKALVDHPDEPARPVHRGGRRRPEHLRLARRDDREPEAPARGIPQPEGHPAGAELPLHQRHPARGQRGDRPEPQALSQEAVERPGRGRAGAGGRVRRRGARGRAGRHRIQALRAQDPRIQFADFAILYRANHQARIFEQKLRMAQIPYKVSGGQSFFDKAEIKDLCAWLRLLVNQDDDPAFLRAVTTPKRGIGHQTLGALGEFSAQWKMSMYEALFAQSLSAKLSAKAIGSLHEFGRYVNDLEYKARHTVGGEDAKKLLIEWLKDIDYEKHLFEHEDSEKVAQARWSNVLDFVDWVAKRCGGQILQEGGTFETEKKSVLEVAQSISVILSLAERDEDQDQVVLTTLHASKGLEWPHVILAGVNEGLLPFKADEEQMTPERLQEERRLMYVGITRAQRSLVVSTLRRRKKGRETIAGIPSRFIAEMKLHEAAGREDPKDRLKRLRAELAAKSAAAPPPAA